jgi:Raf kinase inhibitor-like YbhB/YbcL family protein
MVSMGEKETQIIMKIASTAFDHGETIPRQYSRDAEDKNPPLHITAVPANARSLVLIMDDPDAPRGTFTHWVVFDIDPKLTIIGEDHVPDKARQGANGWGESNYGGPRPPSGEHRYFFRLYALDTKLDLQAGSSREEVERAMQGHVIEQAETMGRFASTQPQPAGRH